MIRLDYQDVLFTISTPRISCWLTIFTIFSRHESCVFCWLIPPARRCSDVIPSFVLMAIKGNKVVTYVYELKDGEVSVSKSEFTKQ